MDENNNGSSFMSRILPPLNPSNTPSSPTGNSVPIPTELPAYKDKQPEQMSIHGAVISEKIDVESDPSFTYDGYQVVRGEFFAHRREPSITIFDYKLYVNAACLRKAATTDFVQALVNQDQRKLVIRPCSEDVKDSFCWCNAKRTPKHISCDLLIIMIAELMQWNIKHQYKIIGKQIESQGEYVFVFDLTSTQVFQRQTSHNPNGADKQRVSRTPVFPEAWKGQFGLPVEEHRKSLQINIFDGYAVFGVKDEKYHREDTLPDTHEEGVQHE